MPKRQNHAHRFRRFAYKNTGATYFQCTLPDCYFKISTELTLGKRNICNDCGNEFLMNSYSIRAAKPKCMDCVKKKKARIIINEIIPKSEAVLQSSATSLKERLVRTLEQTLDDSGEL